MINIDNEGRYVIDSDEYCFMVKERGGVDKKGEPTWKNITYHATHEQVIKQIADIALGKAINHDLVGMVELIEGFKHKFNELKSFKR